MEWNVANLWRKYVCRSVQFVLYWGRVGSAHHSRRGSASSNYAYDFYKSSIILFRLIFDFLNVCTESNSWQLGYESFIFDRQHRPTTNSVWCEILPAGLDRWMVSMSADQQALLQTYCQDISRPPLQDRQAFNGNYSFSSTTTASSIGHDDSQQTDDVARSSHNLAAAVAITIARLHACCLRVWRQVADGGNMLLHHYAECCWRCHGARLQCTQTAHRCM